MPAAKKDDASTDLLANLGNEDATGEVTDLLDEIGEDDDAEAWIPENAGEGIQGTVLSRRTTKSDYTDEPIPVVTIQAADGKKYRVTGFQSVLRREIEENDLQPGDLAAFKYFGKKSNKKGTGSYEHFKVASRKGAGQPAAKGKGAPPF